jgi:hypothetical protein
VCLRNGSAVPNPGHIATVPQVRTKMPGLLSGERSTATFGSRSGHGAAAVLDIGHSLRWYDPGQVQRVCSQPALGGHPGGRFNLLGVPWVVKERPPALALSNPFGIALGSATSIRCFYGAPERSQEARTVRTCGTSGYANALATGLAAHVLRNLATAVRLWR